MDPLDPGSYFDCGRARLRGLDDALLAEAKSRGRAIGDDSFQLVATDMGVIYCRPSISFAIAARWADVTIARPRGDDPVVLVITWPTHGELKFTVGKRLAGNVFRRWLQLRVQADRIHRAESAAVEEDAVEEDSFEEVGPEADNDPVTAAAPLPARRDADSEPLVQGKDRVAATVAEAAAVVVNRQRPATAPSRIARRSRDLASAEVNGDGPETWELVAKVAPPARKEPGQERKPAKLDRRQNPDALRRKRQEKAGDSRRRRRSPLAESSSGARSRWFSDLDPAAGASVPAYDIPPLQSPDPSRPMRPAVKVSVPPAVRADGGPADAPSTERRLPPQPDVAQADATGAEDDGRDGERFAIGRTDVSQRDAERPDAGRFDPAPTGLEESEVRRSGFGRSGFGRSAREQTDTERRETGLREVGSSDALSDADVLPAAELVDQLLAADSKPKTYRGPSSMPRALRAKPAVPGSERAARSRQRPGRTSVKPDQDVIPTEVAGAPAPATGDRSEVHKRAQPAPSAEAPPTPTPVTDSDTDPPPVTTAEPSRSGVSSRSRPTSPVATAPSGSAASSRTGLSAVSPPSAVLPSPSPERQIKADDDAAPLSDARSSTVAAVTGENRTPAGQPSLPALLTVQSPPAPEPSWIGSPVSLVAAMVVISTFVLIGAVAVGSYRRSAEVAAGVSPAGPAVSIIDHQRFRPSNDTGATASELGQPEASRYSETTAPPSTIGSGSAPIAAKPDWPPADGPQTCNSNYSGCVPDVGDVDCPNDGDGPIYWSESAVVMGEDVYELDTDGDGEICEPDQPRLVAEPVDTGAESLDSATDG